MTGPYPGVPTGHKNPDFLNKSILKTASGEKSGGRPRRGGAGPAEYGADQEA